uniref:Uncharacterized protein n=1 Tax=Cajanus cajan TaxID=3821 RepID=A0A151U830_CAJCA|nr:hypothetical protein KK1_008189 [Cajanus cajan]
MDTPMFVALRDNRPTELENQILAMMETNLHNGPVYINNYPNYSIALKSFHNTENNLILDVKILENKWNKNSYPIAIIYRIYYKVMKTQLAPRALLMSPKDETTMLLVNPEKISAVVPRTLKHNELTTGLKWTIEDILKPDPPDPVEVDEIIEYKSGTVEVSFTPIRRTNSLKGESSKASSQTFHTARRSSERPSFRYHKTMNLKGIGTSLIFSPDLVFHIFVAFFKTLMFKFLKQFSSNHKKYGIFS